jgi:hypothetical protein
MRTGELIAGTTELVLVNVATCRTCGRRIRFARRLGSEQRVPLELEAPTPHDHGGAERDARSRWGGTW